MYLMLGTIALEPIDVTDFSEIQAARFAEHQVLKVNLVYKRWVKV